uniref:Protein kinase domain-containing protein n=1 Tax=viral metagenome TaxID=1070528 RepID=A0A6C0HL28_9ZZZZ
MSQKHNTININKISSALLTARLASAKQLDVNTLLTENIKSTQNPNNTQTINDSDTYEINQIVNNNISSKYHITKYLGKGVNGRLYLAKDSKGRLYICKKITVNTQNNNNKQIEFELNILNYLSNNHATSEYINPCLEHKIIGNQIFTIFPVFNGYSLSNMQNYLAKLNPTDYYKIVFYLVKNILQGMATIHGSNIAHQNINANSILVSSESRNQTGIQYDLPIKFTDFGLGCGHSGSSDGIDGIDGIDGNANSANSFDKFDKFASFAKFTKVKSDNYLNKCTGSQLPLTITPKLLSTLDSSGYLKLSKKWDVFCLGCELVKLLLPNVTIPTENGYNENVRSIIQALMKQYFQLTPSKNTETRPKLYANVVGVENDELKADIGAYLDIIIKNMITKSEARDKCQYVLDKLIVYEKYKDEAF